jgi:glucokinase
VTDPSYGPANGSVLALDIGGTKLAAGLVKPDTGTITQFGTIPTPRGDAEQVWRALAAAVQADPPASAAVAAAAAPRRA